jgi:TIR domain
MPTRVGFWSYVHADDTAEGGRIRQLANDLCEQYALLTGEVIDIFVDQDALAWGDNWREKIDSSLASILFFIPVITPRYFLSSQCRRELQEFTRGAERLGVRELVLPLVYVNVPALHEESSVDEAVVLVKTYQWEDWRKLRFEEVASGPYRQAVATLAQRLVDANQKILIEEVAAPDASSGSDPLHPTDEPGLLDILSAGEESIPQVGETLVAIGAEIERIVGIAQQSTEDIHLADQQGKGFAGRLSVARKLAHHLSGPAERILELSNSYTASLYNVDSAIRTMISKGPAEVAADPDQKQNWDQFTGGISELAAIATESMVNIQGFIDSIAQVESMSRDLRPPIQKLRRGLTSLNEGSLLINEWKRLIDEANSIP